MPGAAITGTHEKCPTSPAVRKYNCLLSHGLTSDEFRLIRSPCYLLNRNVPGWPSKQQHFTDPSG